MPFTTVAVAYHPKLGVLLLPIACRVALLRMVFGLPYPSDVGAGIRIGAGVVAVAILPAISQNSCRSPRSWPVRHLL